jgi:hypothetical protein
MEATAMAQCRHRQRDTHLPADAGLTFFTLDALAHVNAESRLRREVPIALLNMCMRVSARYTFMEAALLVATHAACTQESLHSAHTHLHSPPHHSTRTHTHTHHYHNHLFAMEAEVR